jgi:hypothetical protein
MYEIRCPPAEIERVHELRAVAILCQVEENLTKMKNYQDVNKGLSNASKLS